MTKLFEYREYKNTKFPVPFCWKVLATLFTVSVFLAMAVVCGSCQSDEIDTDVVVEEGQPATLRLEVVAEEEMDVATRAVVEDKINNLHVLVYNSKGELIGQKYQTGSSTVTVNTVTATGCTIYAIANTGKADLFSGYDIHKESYLKDMARTVSTWNALTTANDVPMTGSASNVSITPSTPLSMTLTRMVAKIMLEIRANSGVEINNYTLCDLPVKSYYVLRPMDTEGKEQDTGSGTDATNTANSSDWVNSPSIDGVNNAVDATFYMFENRRGVNSSIVTQDKKGTNLAFARATYVTISGTVKGLPVTWKVYLGANNTTNFNIKRNCTYTYKIKLDASGAADSRVTFETVNYVNLSEKENANCYLAAYDNRWYSFDATIRGNGETEDYANQQYSGTYPGISLMPAVISGSANAVAIPKAQVKDAIVVWETSVGLVNWVTWDSSLGCVKFKTGTAKGNAVIAVRNNSNEILWSWHIWRTDGVDLNSLNQSTSKHIMNISTNTDRQWYKALMNRTDIGRRRNITMLRCNLGAQLDDACSYDNANGNIGAYCIHYQFGRKDPFPGAASYASNVDVKIYGYGSSADYITAGFTVSDKKQSSDILSNYDAQATLNYVIKHPEVFICGTNVGSAYNWIHNAENNTMPWAISRCLWGDNSSANEMVKSGELDPDPWGTPLESGKKTIYDPCPAGWRVAAADCWTGFVSDNMPQTWANVATYAIKDDVERGFKLYFNNRNSGISTYFPFTGIRSLSGQLGFENQGNFWEASPSGLKYCIGTSFSGYLSGTSNEMYLASDTNMAYGLSVRCCRIQ